MELRKNLVVGHKGEEISFGVTMCLDFVEYEEEYGEEETILILERGRDEMYVRKARSLLVSGMAQDKVVELLESGKWKPFQDRKLTERELLAQQLADLPEGDCAAVANQATAIRRQRREREAQKQAETASKGLESATEDRIGPLEEPETPEGTADDGGEPTATDDLDQFPAFEGAT